MGKKRTCLDCHFLAWEVDHNNPVDSEVRKMLRDQDFRLFVKYCRGHGNRLLCCYENVWRELGFPRNDVMDRRLSEDRGKCRFFYKYEEDVRLAPGMVLQDYQRDDCVERRKLWIGIIGLVLLAIPAIATIVVSVKGCGTKQAADAIIPPPPPRLQSGRGS